MNELSYAKARIVTRWATAENEAELLKPAAERTANRLTTAIAALVARDETEGARDERPVSYTHLTLPTKA